MLLLKIGIKPECSQGRLAEKAGRYISTRVAVEANLSRNPDKMTRYFLIAVLEIQVYVAGGGALRANKGPVDRFLFQVLTIKAACQHNAWFSEQSSGICLAIAAYGERLGSH